MTAALTTVAVVVAVSVLEGLWTWLLAAAASEVAGARHPPLLFVCSLLGAAWLTARILVAVKVPLARRAWTIVAAGLIITFTAATVHAGLLHPFQIVFGEHQPDHRGPGIVVLLVSAYLWGRGLALARRVTRQRVIGHLATSAAGLAAILVLMPLVNVVMSTSLSIVVTSFLLGASALLLIQSGGAESRAWSHSQWLGFGAGTGILLLTAGAALAGVFSSGFLSFLGSLLARFGRAFSPLTDAILLAAGYLAQSLALTFRWAREIFGNQPDEVQRNTQRAEDARPLLDEFRTEGAPDVLVLLVAVTCTIVFLALTVGIFHRLASASWGRTRDEIEETRTRPGGGRTGLASILQGLVRGRPGGREAEATDPRQRIRQLYRAFQTLMARAGHPRELSQTPSEFEASLSSTLVGAEQDATRITQAYIVARYAPVTTPSPDPAQVAAAVEAVRASLRAGDD